MQYTIRNISPYLDHHVRAFAQKNGISLNQAILEVMQKGLGVAEEPQYYSDLDPLIGTWKEDEEFEEAITDQQTIDDELWQ